MAETDWRAPITDIQRFYGRAGRLEQPFADFPATQEGRLVLVVGGAKSGKTSLLRVLEQTLRTRPPLERMSCLVPVYIPLDARAPTSPATFYERVADAFFSTLKQEPLRLCVLQKATLDFYLHVGGECTIDNFVQAVRYLVNESRDQRDVAGNRIGDLRLIALFDNTDQLASEAWGATVMSDLCALYFDNLAVQSNILLDMVISSAGPFYERLTALRAWSERTRRPLFLEPLTPPELNNWLAAEIPGGPGFLSPALLNWCGGHPFLVRALLETVRQEIGPDWAQVSAADLDDVAATLLETLPELESWAASLTPTARQVLTVIQAASADGLDKQQLRRQVRAQVPELTFAEFNRALDLLLWTGAIRRPVSTLDVFVNGAQLFQQYLAHLAPSQPKPTDLYTPYEVGLQRLLARLGPDHAAYQDAMIFEQRLRETIKAARQYGDNENLRSSRNQVIASLNEMALLTCGESFNNLCP